MKASVVQSLLARNRDEIRQTQNRADHFKHVAEDHYKYEDIDLGHECIKFYRQEKVRLAKLVEIQKELKKELQAIYNKESEQRFYEHICLGSIFKVDSDE